MSRMSHRRPGICRFVAVMIVWFNTILVTLSLGFAQNRFSATEALPPTTVRDRRLEVALATAIELFERQRTTEFVSQIQLVFDRQQDAWTLTSTGDVISIRHAAVRFLQEHPTALADYRRLQGLTAKLELSRARSSGKMSAYLSVWRKFAVTEHGALAAEWLLQRWLDSGAWELAADISIQSLNQRTPVSDRFLKMGILSCELAGWHDEARRIQIELDPGWSPQNSAPLVPLTENWQRSGQAMTPPLLQPDWTNRLEAQEKDLRFEWQLRSWSDEQREQDLPTAVGWAPVVAGNLLIFRDLDTIRALHVTTGETVWRYDTSTGLADLLNPAESSGAALRYRSAIWDAVMANSLVGRLSSDGQRLFAVNDSESMTFAGVYGLEANQLPHFERRKAAQSELIALRVDENPADSRLVWSSNELAKSDARLAGHAFLGPPLVTSGCLFAISEHDRQMCVTALVPDSGEVLWQQPIAEAERAVVEERGRSFRACLPAAAKDLLLCPTHLGLLVAVDPLTGDLRWSHNSLEESADPFPQRFRSLGTVSQRRHGAFPATPLVSDDIVVYLPSQSDHLYCLERETGVVRWVVKNVSAEFLAAIHEDLVVVVGSREVQAISLTDSKIVWRTPLNGVVSGIGLKTEAGYLVPLDSGEIVDLDWKTGQLQGFRFGAHTHAVGHLVANGTQVLSVGIDGIAAFPQTQTVLNRLQERSLTEPAAAITLARAEVHLTTGHLDAAVTELETAMQVQAPAEIRDRARKTLVEVYFELAMSSTDRSSRWLTKLGALDLTPEERVRWLVAATAAAEAEQQRELLIARSRDLAECAPTTALFEVPNDRGLHVSADVWLTILARRTAEMFEPQTYEHLLQETAANHPQSLAYRAWELLSPQRPEIAEFQRNEASRALQKGEYPQALVWLRRQASTDGQLSAQNRQLLMELFTNLDWPTTAAQIARLGAPAEAPRDADDFGQGMGQDRSWQAWLRHEPVQYPVDSVQIQSHARRFLTVSESPSRARETAPYEDYQRQIFAVAHDSPIEWLVRNTERGTEVAGFDKLSSRKVFEHVLPLGAGPPGATVRLPAGSFVPFAMPGEIQAISPISGPQGHLAWTLKLPEWTNRSGQAVCGPMTSKTCYFQWKSVLLAVDPIDGRVRWRRNDLESGSGLYGDARIGLLADDDIVFLLAADKTRYTVMDASTGQILRRGSFDFRSFRSELGRYVLHFTDDGDDRRIRIWDPATDQWILDDQLKTRQLHSRCGNGSVAWITPDRRLRLFSVEEQKLLVDVELAGVDWNSATQLRVLIIDGWYLASLGRSSPSNTSTQFHMPVQDRLIPGDTFKDDVFAITPSGRRVQWRRQMPQRSFLEVKAPGLPFFVTATLVKDNQEPNRRWLRVEAVDRETGILLGVGDDLPVDRLLYADYDGQSGRVTLMGRQTEIELDFSPKVQREAAEPGAF
ncbi:PQQ-binding-like beta-propeller repeat protein [bacterium]|nr:PQQ-binding-like beta-propeller repeat protein [bacterium]